MPRVISIVVPLALLTGCDFRGSGPATEPEQAQAANAAPPAAEIVAAGESSTGTPAAIQGNWALTEADCVGGAAAKGLLEIGGTTLTFYESRATLEQVKQRGVDHIRARFAFTGEGMEWQREILLHLDGDVLIRREYGEDAPSAPLRYTRCS